MSSSSALTAVIFDCDGVLVDTEPLHYQAFQEVLRPLGLGHDYDHYLKHFIGFDDRDAFLEAFKEAGRSIDSAALTDLMQAKGRALRRLISNGVVGFPGVVSLVHELTDNHVPLAVASGALRDEVEAFIGELGLRQAFPILVGADDVARSKPDPETYLLALERLKSALGMVDLDPRACAAIEDTPTGIRSAKAAGLYVIGVAHSYPGTALSEAHYVVEKLTELNLNRLVELISQSNS